MPVLACRPQHKKLAEGSAYEEVPTSVMYSENDISNSIKNGILYLEDPVSLGDLAAPLLEHEGPRWRLSNVTSCSQSGQWSWQMVLSLFLVRK